jgi:hypothetical protein
MQALSLGKLPLDLRRVGAKVHVVPEKTIEEDVRKARPNEPGNEHHDPEINDDIGVVT